MNKNLIPSQEHWQVIERSVTDLFETKADGQQLTKKSAEEGGQNPSGTYPPSEILVISLKVNENRQVQWKSRESLGI